MITLPLLRDGFDAFGFDLDVESINYGRRVFAEEGVDASRLAASDYLSIDDHPDVIIASEVLEHIRESDVGAVLDTFRAKLGPGGRLLVTVPNGYGWFEIESALWKLGLGRIIARLRVDVVLDRLRVFVLGDAGYDAHPNTLADAHSPHVRRFTLRSARALLSSHGFEVESATGSVIFAGPLTHLVLRGVGPFMRLNGWLGSRATPMASGFFLSCRIKVPMGGRSGRTSWSGNHLVEPSDVDQANRGPSFKEKAAAVWGASPAGATFAPRSEPGTRDFFDTVRARRSTYEMPWLAELVPFASYRDRDVLELGCGAGYDAFDFATEGARYTGIDLAAENIVRTKAHLALDGLSGDIRQADAESLPFDDASFDLVYSNGVLHHTPHIERALREANRVLRPGAELWVIVYHRSSIFYWLTLFLEHYVLRREYRVFASFADRLASIEYTTSDVKPLVSAYTRTGLTKLLTDSGFGVTGLWVRKLAAEDLPTLPGLRRLWPRVPSRLLDGLGRRWGWYLIAHGRKAMA